MRNVATKAVGGFPEGVLGPTTTPYSTYTAQPNEMTLADIEEFKAAWGAAVKRAVAAGVDVIEIHAAHGYLLSSFNSPASNTRTDQYGGTFENRTRLSREIVQITREEIPVEMPLFLRISATDWLEGVPSIEESWTVESSIEFAPILASLGVDLLDISSGGVHSLQRIRTGPGFQVPFAKAIKAAVGDKLLVSAVGLIQDGKFANRLLEEEPSLDVIMAGRMFQKNPALVWYWADDLGVKTRLAHQIRWGFEGRGDSLKMA
jgi:2,4-dienoyl-CoA reductase-like NADH-dependent reductase (Old Yellow Enzyme family)